jgi:hypothetical protein
MRNVGMFGVCFARKFAKRQLGDFFNLAAPLRQIVATQEVGVELIPHAASVCAHLQQRKCDLHPRTLLISY